MAPPIELAYFGVLFAVAFIAFGALKRPMYEAMLYAFIALVAVTGTWSQTWNFIWDAMTNSSLYVIIVFVISASLLGKTSVIDDCIAVILAIFGRVTGGAGFVAVIGSSYMGSLSGSGPGNVATTGVFTIPAMINSGFPRHLAANVEAHASAMGNMIPPAGMIATAFGILDALYPGRYTMADYWMGLWGVAIWFIIQRIITLVGMCKYYKVAPMRKEDVPKMSEALARGWKAIFLPIVVILPFLLYSNFEDFFKARMGAGASSFNSSLLLFLPSFIVIFGIWLSDKATKKKCTLPFMMKSIENGMTSVVPTSALVLFAYCVSNVFLEIDLEGSLGPWLIGLNLSRVALCFILPLITSIIGMMVPGSTQIKIFGGLFITVLAGSGMDPFLAACMLPAICGATHGTAPPYCGCVYVGMGIAQAEFWPTIKNTLVWNCFHYAISVICMLDILPMAFMNV